MEVTVTCVCLLLCISFVYAEANRTFTIDHENNCFLKDGEPFRYVSGSLHYFRIPNQYWRDRMEKIKAAGLNALETYVEWSGHEHEPGTYNFEGNYDLITFLKTAQEVGLLVVFRPGPYICAERDMGGFPYWLLRDSPNIQLRTMDPLYINPVQSWMTHLLTMIEPFLYKNGGPVILVQIENEYGQHDRCDKEYMKFLRDLNWDILGKDVILFRTDIPGDNFYKCDFVEGVMVTADFGSDTNLANASAAVLKNNHNGPLVATEYYPGWMDHWGEPHSQVSADAVCKTLKEMLAANWSVNFYMFHGGTNFGLTSGANAPFNPQPTSYDYGSPLSEAGDPTALYMRIRDIVGNYLPLPPGPVPEPSPKLSLSEPLQFEYTGSVISSLQYQKKVYSQYPITFEELSVSTGFVVYSTLLTFIPSDPAPLTVKSIGDRVYVLVDGFFVGILSRQLNIYSMPILIQKDQILTLIVESQGRINYGEETRDFKGLLSNVTLDDTILENWTITPVSLSPDNLPLTQVDFAQSEGSTVPGYFVANFTLASGTQIADTFLDPSGWRKGVAILNGFNLGRYWPVMGPQVTLYVPGVLLKPYPETNTLVILELEIAPCGSNGPCSMRLVDQPIIDGPVPTSGEKRQTDLYQL